MRISTLVRICISMFIVVTVSTLAVDVGLSTGAKIVTLLPVGIGVGILAGMGDGR